MTQDDTPLVDRDEIIDALSDNVTGGISAEDVRRAILAAYDLATELETALAALDARVTALEP